MLRTATALTALLLTGPALADGHMPSENQWFQDAQAALEARLAQENITGRAKNVILLVADGNGVATNYATRIWEGQQMGGYGDEHVLHHETFPNLALSKTYNTNGQTPDSSGTATAFLSGVKTKAGVVGVDETVHRGNCSQVEAGALPSIADILAEQGKAVGVVSTARITHATPAAAYSSSADRNYEADSNLPEGCEHADIASQLMEKMNAGVIDVAMGGGRRNFIPSDHEDEEGKGGKRSDGRNMIQEVIDAGGQYAWNDETFAELSDDGGPVLALFESSHMKYEHDRAGEPSLAEMTARTIEMLSGNEDGFFLLVEAGRVDHANHDGNLHRTVTDGVAFAAAIKAADEATDDADTLIVVTADHDHALQFMGYCGRGTPITGLCYGVDGEGEGHNGEPQLGADGKPYTVAGYLNGAGSIMKEGSSGVYFGYRPNLTQEEATDPDYLQQALVPRSSETHSGVDVAIYAKGPWAHLFDGTVEQNYIFNVMIHAAEAE